MAARLGGKKEKKEGTDKAPEAGASGGASAKKERSHFPLLVLILIVSLIAALAAIAALFMSGYMGTKTTGDGKKPALEVVIGPTVQMGEFIVNLGNVDERRFLRTKITLEMEIKSDGAKKKSGGGGHGGGGDENKELLESLKHKEPLFKDMIVRILSSKTAGEIGTPRGKEELSEEIVAKLNKKMSAEEYIKHVYFTEFIIQ